MLDYRNSPLFAPRRSPNKSPRIKCASCLKWHADVQCRHDLGEVQSQDDPQDVTAVLVSTIDRLTRTARIWETRAKEAVEYARQVSIEEHRKLSRQLTEALTRNYELELQLKASQLSATNLESESRSARQRAADQDSTICILRKQCNAASASAATVSMRIDVLKSELLQAQESSRHRVMSLEQEVKSLKKALEEKEVASVSANEVLGEASFDLSVAVDALRVVKLFATPQLYPRAIKWMWERSEDEPMPTEELPPPIEVIADLLTKFSDLIDKYEPTSHVIADMTGLLKSVDCLRSEVT